MKKVLLGVVLGITVVLGGLFAFNKYNNATNTTINEVIVEEQVESVCKLCTKQYSCTVMDKYSKTRTFHGVKIPFTTTSFTASYDVDAYIGVDLEDVSVLVAGKVIIITLPHAKVMGNPSIDQDSFVLLDKENSIFYALSAKDVNDFQKDQNDMILDRIDDLGLYDEAEEDVRKTVQKAVKQLPGSEDYEVLVYFL